MHEFGSPQLEAAINRSFCQGNYTACLDNLHGRESKDEVTQDSFCARVSKRGRYSRAGDIGIDAKGAVIGLRSVPRKSTKSVQNAVIDFLLYASMYRKVYS